MKLNDGDSVAAALVVGAAGDSEDLLISTMNGMVLRISVDQCRVYQRTAKGNIVVKLKDEDEVSAVTTIQSK